MPEGRRAMPVKILKGKNPNDRGMVKVALRKVVIIFWGVTLYIICSYCDLRIIGAMFYVQGRPKV